MTFPTNLKYTHRTHFVNASKKRTPGRHLAVLGRIVEPFSCDSAVHTVPLCLAFRRPSDNRKFPGLGAVRSARNI